MAEIGGQGADELLLVSEEEVDGALQAVLADLGGDGEFGVEGLALTLEQGW
jgi:hypothetical protein